MERLRRNWLISNLLIMAFGGLVAWQGCGGGGGSKNIIEDDIQQPNSTIRMSMPSQINFQITEDISDITTEVDLNRGIVTLSNGSESLVIRFDQTTLPTRTHIPKFGPIQLPKKSNYGNGNMWAAGALDTGHQDDTIFPEMNLPHYNFYIWDSESDMRYDELQHFPKKAVADIHLQAHTCSPHLTGGYWIKENWNPNGKRLGKKWDPPPWCNVRVPTKNEITEIARNLIDSLLIAIEPYLDTIGIIAKTVLIAAVIAFIAIAAFILAPIILAWIIEILTAAGLTIGVGGVVIGATECNPYPDDPPGGGGGGNPPSTPTPNPGGPIPMPNIPPDEPSDPPVTPDPPTPATLAGLATLDITHVELNFRIKVISHDPEFDALGVRSIDTRLIYLYLRTTDN